LGVPVIDDLGSGALAGALPRLADEPDVRASLAAGAAMACFSGEKLFGGPPAGPLAGSRGAGGRARRYPVARALRIGRLLFAALGPDGWRPEQLAETLRREDPPLLSRIFDGRVLVDPRTLLGDEADEAARIIARVIRRGPPPAG